MANIRKIQKISKDGTVKEITVDFDKLPCAKCEWRWSIHCPKCEWNAKGEYNVY